MDDMRLEPGTVLADKYRLESVLGTGGMGTVYQAEHLALKAPVAVKVIDREVTEGDVALARFMREAQSAASLRSPHVVQILDYGMEGDRPFMVMEMLEGEPLADRLKRVGRLSPADTYRVINHVAKAVSKAHEADIIHRDLKPDNVFLVHNEGDEIAKVLDFGVAKVDATQLDGEGHTRTGSLLGTPYYMSPEQAQGNKDIDARSDLWALGVIAFECLTGKRPFSSDGLGDLVLQICIRDIPKPSEVVPVPAGFDDWFFKACTREPDERFQTARDLAESLRPALDLESEPGGSVPESKWSGAAAPPRRTSPASVAPTLSSETTQRDPTATPAATTQDARTTDVDPEGPAGEGAGRKSEPQDSQWEIVPHGEKESPSEEELEAAAQGSESSGGGSIAFVAIIALLLGGAIVFGVKQAGVDVLGDDSNGTTDGSSSGENGTGETLASPPRVKKKPTGPAVKPAASGEPGEELGNDGSAEGDEDPENQEGTGEDEEGAEGSDPDGDESGEGDALDAIEDEASKTLEEREKEAAQQDKEAKSKGISSKDEAPKDDPTGPQPKLPEGLAPTPAPPPPPGQ